MKILKYILHPHTRQTIEVPKGALLLASQIQHGKPCLWVQVDESTEMESRTIVMVATGQPMPPVGGYLGTFQFSDGSFVLHAFTEA